MVSGKNIVITGCLQGIGKETLRVFAEHGASVFACSYKETEEFDAFCKKLAEDNCVSIFPIYFDMMDETSIKAAAREIQLHRIPIDGLVNIAGINKDAYFGMIRTQDMLDTFTVNVFSQIIFTQYIVKLMQRSNTKGSVVFTSSVSAIDGNAGQTVYAASKAALIGAMRTMALELGPHGIRVNAVAPGVISSPMTDKLDPELLKRKIDLMDIPRIGSASEVANTYMFLMSELSSHVSGEIIRVDGGIK